MTEQKWTADSGSSLSMKVFVAIVLAVWLVLVVFLGIRHGFITPSGTPPYRIALGVGLPLVVFFITLWTWSGFRSFMLKADLPLLTAVQAWRFAGFGFIALYVHGILPGSFAWPAGLGDIAIGLTAPCVALALIRRPGFASGQIFLIWNLLGILDLVVAVSSGALNQVFATPGAVTTAAMAQVPLVLIPAYFVPLFIIFHVVSLLQRSQMLRA